MFAGLLVKELHLCGSETFLPIIERLCMKTGDRLLVKRYKRLCPLVPSRKALKNLHNIMAGDCVVGFSRKELYILKSKIESFNPLLKCCVIYGNLPPDSRREQVRSILPETKHNYMIYNMTIMKTNRVKQAKLFNDSNSKYNVLVASDAIGMGLNLSIRRIVFSTLEKFDGRQGKLISSSNMNSCVHLTIFMRKPLTNECLLSSSAFIFF